MNISNKFHEYNMPSKIYILIGKKDADAINWKALLKCHESPITNSIHYIPCLYNFVSNFDLSFGIMSSLHLLYDCVYIC